MKKILILGGGGFVGINLVNHFALNENYEVHATWNQSLPRHMARKAIHHNCNLLNRFNVKNLLDDISPDIVVHAAAVTTGSKDVVERPFVHVTDNAIMNSLVFEECFKKGVGHVIFMSCSVMYQPKETPQKESDWNAGEEIYSSYFGVGNMKVYSEKLCEFYSKLGKTKYTAIRNSNIYGPYDKFDLDKCHVFPAMIAKVSKATDTLEVWGDGSARRDLIYIDDVVDLIEKVIEKQEKNFELFNCGVGLSYSIKYIIDVIQAQKKKDLKLIFNASKPNIPTTVVLDTEKAQTILGWQPKTDLWDGTAKTLEYYKLTQK